jgi:hypothetical protein
MRRIVAGLLWPVACVGSILGLGYLVLTGRHPSPTMLMALGFGGVSAFAWSVLHLMSQTGSS